MTQRQHRNSISADVEHAPPAHTPRLRLKPKAPTSGYVDGAWWPHSVDLISELPDLLAVLSVRLGRISRVIYSLGEWAEAPKKLSVGGRDVRLDGYRLQPSGTVEILGLSGNKVVLLVVAPDLDPAQAHAIMMTAAGPNNATSVGDLMLVSADGKST
jgi:hypothetical protein